ncbi:MAG TPA: acyltransferase [Pirellulales bacterium]|nr:acyltransferase [Pirellulales bacterium]
MNDIDCVGLAPLPDRYRSLDVWRGIACFLVVLIHAFSLPTDLMDSAGPWSNVGGWINRVATRLWIGVPIFFVLSGYCIGAAADAHGRRRRPIREFFTSRLRRIYVPYFAALALTAGLAALFDLVSSEHRLSEVGVPNPAALSPANWFGNLTLTEGLLSGLPGHVVRYQLLPAWTLCQEVQFYAISGLLLWVASRHFFLAVAAFTAFGAIAVGLAARFGVHLPQGCVLRGTWLMFAMGLAVYWQVAAGTRRARWLTLGLLLVPLTWSLCHPQLLVTLASNNHQNIFIAAITALLLVLLHPFDVSLSSRAILAPLAKLGTISFSVYLIHFPVIRFCDMQRTIWLGTDMVWGLLVLLSAIALSMVAGELFYRAVERRTIGRWQKGQSQPAAGNARLASGGVVYLRVMANPTATPIQPQRSSQGEPATTTLHPAQPIAPAFSAAFQEAPSQRRYIDRQAASRVPRDFE